MASTLPCLTFACLLLCLSQVTATTEFDFHILDDDMKYDVVFGSQRIVQSARECFNPSVRSFVYLSGLALNRDVDAGSFTVDIDVWVSASKDSSKPSFKPTAPLSQTRLGRPKRARMLREICETWICPLPTVFNLTEPMEEHICKDNVYCPASTCFLHDVALPNHLNLMVSHLTYTNAI
jgi:hypothetical protein